MGQLEDPGVGWEQTYDELSELAANPMDINRCTREDLERLPFLSSQQIMDILEYRDRYGRIESEAELMMIPTLDWRTRNMLLQFVAMPPDTSVDSIPSLRALLAPGRNELLGTFKLPFYTRRGDKNGYLGYQYRHWLRFTHQVGQYLKVALVASQDAGEPFFAGKNSAGYDFYSGYVLLRHLGRLKAGVVGRYKLRFGMGLILNNSFGLSKLATLSNLGRSSTNVLGYGSRSEAYYLQGAAATVTMAKGLDLTAFASWRKIDATMRKDTVGIATILTSGYHRTKSEMNRRRNAAQTVVGGNLNYYSHGFHCGATGYYTAYDTPLAPDKRKRYKRWSPEGKRFWNASIDYGYQSNRITIGGETATGDSHSIATLNTVSWQPSSSFSLVALQRYYAYQFYAPFSESFAEGGDIQNESGIYLGANYVPFSGFTLQAYTDFSYFAWDKYLTRAGSHCWDNMVSAKLEKRHWALLARYRLKMREHDNDDHSALVYKNEHRGRLALDYVAPHFTLRTQGDVAYCDFEDKSFGWMVSEGFTGRWRWLRAAAVVGYFHTDDYASRLYVYERGMLYSFSFPMFYGEGIHYSLNLLADLSRHVMLMAKVTTTDYFDRNHISSGLQQIDHSSMTDLELQLRWKF
jgi:hypothetical protein